MKTAISRHKEKSEDTANLLKRIRDLKNELVIAEALLEKSSLPSVDESKMSGQIVDSHTIEKHVFDATLWEHSDSKKTISESRLIESNKKVIKKSFRESIDFYKILSEFIPLNIWICGTNGELEYASSTFLESIGSSLEEARAFGWTKRLVPEDVGPVLNRLLHCVKMGEDWECELRFLDKTGKLNTVLSRNTPVKDSDGKILYWAGIILDITERKKNEEELSKLEYLCKRKSQVKLLNSINHITKLQNPDHDCEIFNAISEKILADIVNYLLDVLDISTSVIERSGDCALNLYSSEWCRRLDTASKNLCKDELSNEISGNWRCNNSCRKGAVENVIKSGSPIEFSCTGGLNIYAVPIRVGKEIIGAISIAYGDITKNERILEKISKDFDIDQIELGKLAEKHVSHPDFIIELVKNRLHLSAHLIGTLVERKRVETVLKKTNAEIEKRVDSRAAALKRSYNLLKEETKERLKAEKELKQRNKALESVYAMSMSFGVSIEAIFDQVVQSISGIIQVPFVVSGIIEKNELSFVSEFNEKELIHKESVTLEQHSCGIPFQEKRVFQRTGSFERIYPGIKELHGMRAFVGVPVLSSKGKMIGSICIADKKERKFGEYELHLVEIFARYLGHEIERRTIERQLLQSQEMKMLGQLTSGVAHEVRNPLNGILAITDALSKDLGENPEYKIYIEHIRKQVTRLSGLMRDLLDLGRPMENSNLQPTSCTWLVSSAVNIWQHSSLFNDHRIRLIYEQDAERLTVNIDRTKIEQVIINLLENACAHCPADSDVIINIEPEGESLVLFRIIDRGTGIKPEHFEHLFEPFFTTRKGGTGLGLGIVKRIVESHGGVVEIWNNTPPPGVTVEFRLPVIPGN